MHRDDFDSARFATEVVDMATDPACTTWARVHTGYNRRRGARLEIEARLGAFTSQHTFVPFVPNATFRPSDTFMGQATCLETSEWTRGDTRFVHSDTTRSVTKQSVAHIDWPDWGLRLAIAHETETECEAVVPATAVRTKRYSVSQDNLTVTYTTVADAVCGRWEIETVLAYGHTLTELRQHIARVLNGFASFWDKERDRYQAWLLLVRVQAWKERLLQWPLKWGLTPVLMKHGNLAAIQHAPHDWVVTAKADGQRSYLILGQRLAVRVTPAGALSLVSVPPIPIAARWSILDGEYIDFLFWTFDIVAHRGTFLYEPFDQRWAHQDDFAGLQTHHVSCAVRWKPQFTHNDGMALGTRALHTWRATHPFPVDGLVLTHRSAVPGSAFKWRPYHTIDVSIGGYDPTSNTCEAFGAAQAQLQVVDLRVVGEWPRGTIVECYPTSSGWSVLRVRADKVWPNQVAPTILDAMAYVSHPVLIEAFDNEYVAASGRKYKESPDDEIWRSACNAVKRDLLNSVAGVLIDIGSGKGGDVHKWIANPALRVVVAIEPSHDQLHGANGFLSRVASKPQVKCDTHWRIDLRPDLVLFILPVALHDVLWPCDILTTLAAWPAPTVTSFFTWHYICQDKTSFEGSLRVLAQVQVRHMHVIYIDMAHWPSSMPNTAMTIQRTVREPRPCPTDSLLRAYVRYWASPRDTLLVSWPHWEQAIEEVGLTQMTMAMCLMYHGWHTKHESTVATSSDGSTAFGPYLPWAQAYRVVRLEQS